MPLCAWGLTSIYLVLGTTGLLAAPEPVVSYRIDVQLDAEQKTLTGRELLTWRNTTAEPTRELYFHLYLNAFRNTRSTFAQEGGFESFWKEEGEIPRDHWGFMEIDSLQVLEEGQPAAGRFIGSTYAQPDDGNADDQTVLRVDLARAIRPGEQIQLAIGFTSKLPRGTARTGWADEYFFAAQWFPKLGVFEDGRWNCHQYHRNTEYYADFGDYDVTITVPARFSVGATGRGIRTDRDEGTATYRFTQNGVHDFAWVASSRFLQLEDRFEWPGMTEVQLILLLLPEHRHLGERHLLAAKRALRWMGEWFGPYPYDILTIVDPAHGSDTGGMEYPTLITAGTHFWSPPGTLSPESVIVHEVGHQWWYGVVASNEFEEAWLDEGITSWAASRVLRQAYPPARYTDRLFGGIPLLFDSVPIPFETSGLASVRRAGDRARMDQTSWQLRDPATYTANSYSKPELVLWTLERLLGEELMLRAMRTYFERYSFSHAGSADFMGTLEEVTGQDLDWFFDETFKSSELVDYAITEARSRPLPEPQGLFDEPGGSSRPSEPEAAAAPPRFLIEVEVARLEGARLPVEVLLVFEDGREIRRNWDGRERRYRLDLEMPVALVSAMVDPERKILLDIDPTNNSRFAEEGSSATSTAARKWTSKWLFWLQNLLETFAFLG